MWPYFLTNIFRLPILKGLHEERAPKGIAITVSKRLPFETTNSFYAFDTERNFAFDTGGGKTETTSGLVVEESEASQTY